MPFYRLCEMRSRFIYPQIFAMSIINRLETAKTAFSILFLRVARKPAIHSDRITCALSKKSSILLMAFHPIHAWNARGVSPFAQAMQTCLFLSNLCLNGQMQLKKDPRFWIHDQFWACGMPVGPKNKKTTPIHSGVLNLAFALQCHGGSVAILGSDLWT